MGIVAQDILRFSDIVDADMIIVSACGQKMFVGFDAADLLLMELLEIYILFACSGIYGSESFVLASSEHGISLELYGSDSVGVIDLDMPYLCFVIVIANESAEVVSNGYFHLGRGASDGVDCLLNFLEMVFAGRASPLLVPHGHVEQLEIVVHGHADEVVVGPIEQIRVKIVAPSFHMDVTKCCRLSLLYSFLFLEVLALPCQIQGEFSK